MIDITDDNHKIVLLYRLHIVVIFVNLFAIFIDFFPRDISMH